MRRPIIDAVERLRSALRLSRAAAAPPAMSAALSGVLYAAHDARPLHLVSACLAPVAAGFAFLGASVLRDTLDAASGVPATGEGAGLPALLARGEASAAEALALAAAWWLLAFLAAACIAPLAGARALFLTVGAAALSVLHAAPPVALRRLGRGLGEAGAFVGLGVLPFAMGYASQTGETSTGALLASLPAGCWGAAVSLAADLDGLEDDRRSGKLSTAVGLGAAASRSLQALLAVAAVLTLAVAIRSGELPSAALCAVLSAAPIGFALARLRRGPRPLAGFAVASAALGNLGIVAGVLVEMTERG